MGRFSDGQISLDRVSGNEARGALNPLSLAYMGPWGLHPTGCSHLQDWGCGIIEQDRLQIQAVHGSSQLSNPSSGGDRGGEEILH